MKAAKVIRRNLMITLCAITAMLFSMSFVMGGRTTTVSYTPNSAIELRSENMETLTVEENELPAGMIQAADLGI